MSSKQQERRLAAAIETLGTSLATHPRSTFKSSGAGCRTLEQFKGLRAAHKFGLLGKFKPRLAECDPTDGHTTQIAQLPVRKAG